MRTEEEKRKAVEMLMQKNVLVTPEMLSKLEAEPSVEILFSYQENSRKRDCSDFVAYFNDRFRQIEKILMARPEVTNLTTIGRLKMMKPRDKVSIIGIIEDKQTTKNENLMLTLEDQTGKTRVIVNKNNPELFSIAKDCVNDEVIAINGTTNGEIIFANNIILPDIPNGELKKGPIDNYAAFLSDIHVGSKKFLGEDFEKFLKWISGELGNEDQRELASKVKYIFIIGDVVDGVGIYPDQEEELEITDIYKQYKKCAELLSKIPLDKKLIISPGNHDSMRISEPQPAFTGEIFEPLAKLPNAMLVSNPALVRIEKSENFSGLDVLMYHGYSFDYYVANVESIRTKGGYDRADLIMKFLLERRHLSPTHTATLYLPNTTDNHVIRVVPDIFATGHIHRSYASQYKHVTLISSSCWQGKTSFQERMGHVPQPARVPIINLKTREVTILKFGEENG